jgi:hypothetical protein
LDKQVLAACILEDCLSQGAMTSSTRFVEQPDEALISRCLTTNVRYLLMLNCVKFWRHARKGSEGDN